MKKFHFKMEYFLSYQMYQKMQYEEKLAETVQGYLRVKIDKDKYQKKVMELKEKASEYINSDAVKDSSFYKVSDHFFYLKNINNTLEYQDKMSQNKLNKINLECKELKEKWLFFYKKVKAIEILKEKEYKKYLIALQKEEDEEFNEMFTIKNLERDLK